MTYANRKAHNKMERDIMDKVCTRRVTARGHSACALLAMTHLNVALNNKGEATWH
jgi:hypothetical protein